MSHDVDIDTASIVHRCSQVVARKDHRCCSCGEPIPAGHRYSYTFSIWDGNNYIYKRCLRCDVIFKALCEEFRKIGAYDVWPDEDLRCGHEWVENLGIPLPPEIERLAFLTAAEAQQVLVPAEVAT